MKINWPTKKLGKVCYFEGGKQPPKIHFIDQPKNGYIRLIQIRDFRSDDKAVYIPKELAKNWVDKDDILISRYGGFRNYKSFFNILTGKSGAFNVALIKVIPDESLVNKKFIYFQLQLPRYKNILIKKSDRAVQSGFRRKDLENLEVVIPPLSIQQKIVKRLDIIIKTQELNEKQIELVEELIQGLLNKELYPEGKGWEEKKLKEVAKLIRGPFGSSLKKEIFVESGYKVYEQQNIIHDDFMIGDYYINKDKYNEMIRFAIKPGDLILSCSGTIGKVAIVPNNALAGIINQALLKITPITMILMEPYLKLAIDTKRVQHKLLRKTRGSAIRNIASVQEIKNIKIPLPPLKTQKRIVEKLSLVQDYKKKLLKQKELLQELFESTLNKAMRVELVK